jgi:LysM repeat protein/uncharacterized protein YvpB
MSPVKRLFRIFALVISFTLIHASPARGESLPDSAEISGLSGHAQGYSLSCESRSAVDLAAFWGLSIVESEFLQALPRDDNPDEGFVGDPSDAWGTIPPQGYGVHAGPVAETLQVFGLVTEAHHDLSWDDLRGEINAGRPVIVWVIGQMWGGKPVEYEALDGSTTTVAAYEHTMILTGYSPDTVQVVDAYSGGYQSYQLKTFLKSWAVLGNMAVFGSREISSNEDSVKLESHAESYTVQYGDYLTELAESFGTTWQALAQLNSIGYPYTIFPGQVLQLPGGEEPVAVSEAKPEVKSEVVKPPSNNKIVNFQVHLPMVQHNYSALSSSSEITTASLPAPAKTVVVRISNTLPGFCKSLGVDWHRLVKLNDLHPPYLVRPGQVLKLR